MHLFFNFSIAKIMKNSGCDVPKYMLSMKEPHTKREKLKLQIAAASKRENITTQHASKKNKYKKGKKFSKNDGGNNKNSLALNPQSKVIQKQKHKNGAINSAKKNNSKNKLIKENAKQGMKQHKKPPQQRQKKTKGKGNV